MQQKISSSPVLSGARTALVLESANSVLIDMFGTTIAEHMHAVQLKQDTVTIACLYAPLAQEIRLRQAEFIERLNTKHHNQSGVRHITYLLDDPL